MSNELEFKKEEPAKRHAVDLKFEFKKTYGRQMSTAQFRNLSLTGALIKTELALRPEEKINVFLTVQGRRRKIAARVVWTAEHGLGIEFMPFNNRDLQIVDDILYYATEKNSSNKTLIDNIFNKVA